MSESPDPAPLAMMQIELLRGVDRLIAALGGDAAGLLAAARIDPDALADRHALVPFAAMAALLERAARSLSCPDFGMRLAAIQGRGGASGPLYVAMRHSQTLGAALSYAAAHTTAATSGTTMSLEFDREQRTAFLRFTVIAPGPAGGQRQVLEHGLTLLLHHVQTLGNGRVRPREAWFMHAPQASPATYRAFLGCPVRFGKAMTGLLFEAADLGIALADTDPWLYELATSYIARESPPAVPALAQRVRATVERLLVEGRYSLETVAAALAMHPRTLQRRLAEEGAALEQIRDEVRRDLLRRYLPDPGMSLLRLAELLGYSEASALTRACNRWFGQPPRVLRARWRADESR
ncbi:MAG: AraC family transcriptional regulator ligand-binding domain-containing protein [Sphingomonadales bacterium]|nr:AraC family transcriptional regulator ligand-binding domain-containing protein [Sphingomonadales bacterium]